MKMPKAILVVAMLVMLNGSTTSTAVQSVTYRTSFVEGNCNKRLPISQSTMTTPGTCGDYDGDGRIGTAEDDDEDQVFGTISAAIGSSRGAQRIYVTIVTSGVFYDDVIIAGTRGTVTLEAAPGVEAILEIAPGGETVSDTGGFEGITIASSTIDGALDSVVVRNITIRNFTTGIAVSGASRVSIENCRIHFNADYGIRVRNTARVTISDTQVTGAGFFERRDDTDTVFQPNPASGIEFQDNSSGTVFMTTVRGNKGAGIINRTNNRNAVCAYLVNVFDNSPNYLNVTPTSEPCGYGKKGRAFFDR